jgi:hypothetical protein
LIPFDVPEALTWGSASFSPVKRFVVLYPATRSLVNPASVRSVYLGDDHNPTFSSTVILTAGRYAFIGRRPPVFIFVKLFVLVQILELVTSFVNILTLGCTAQVAFTFCNMRIIKKP